MGYTEVLLQALRENAKFIKISQASLKEGHPHDVMITKEAQIIRYKRIRL